MIRFRLRVVRAVILLFAALITLRLFYWQIIKSTDLSSKAISQHQSIATLTAKRGSILAADQSLLASIEERFLLYVYKPKLIASLSQVIDVLTPILTSTPPPASPSSTPLTQEEYTQQTKDFLTSRLLLDKSWTAIKNHLSLEQKQVIEGLNLPGLGFESQFIRYYPEASMSAHMLGFVGNDVNGSPQGYFGLEGYYERQLQGRAGLLKQETDALGNPILIGDFANYQSKNGRDLLTTIDRRFQYQVERFLTHGLEKYQAKSGSVIVMQPQTGAILAMASLPAYDPRYFYLYPTSLYKNPIVADLFEPGSVFKPLVLAAAIDTGAIEPETTCDQTCEGIIRIGTYTIKTWNERYYPGTNMTETLIHSDNTGMVFAARRLGAEKLRGYLEKFGLGQLTGVDLQEEVAGILRPVKDWKEADLATISFGQGIAVTPIQLITAINTITNQGKLVQPYLVTSIKQDQNFIPTKHSPPKQIISPQTAQKLTQIMIAAVDQGDAKWARPKNILIAGKTGTAQIPVKGHYDEEKTIASFIGFAPADNPQFTMLVTLREPQLSPWGSETAAPLWFDIAKQLLLLN